MTLLNIRYGLFKCSFFRHPIIWLTDLKVLIERFFFILKHGYSPIVRWEYYESLIALSEEVFKWALEHRSGDIPFDGCAEEEWESVNDEFYSSLLADLAIMRKYEPPFTKPEEMDEITKAKEHFFNTISEYFWSLWD